MHQGPWKKNCVKLNKDETTGTTHALNNVLKKQILRHYRNKVIIDAIF